MKSYICVDLEASCWDKKDWGKPKTSEIIEIGAVWCNDRFEVLSKFDEFIQPIIHTKLSDYCKDLTTIKQSDIDSSWKFPVVLAHFSSWIESCVHSTKTNGVFCSWGDYDRKMFVQDCKLHNVAYPFSIQHINLKSLYANSKKCKPLGMKEAMIKSNIDLDGTHHRGIDDAVNIAKICNQEELWRSIKC